MLFRAAHDQDFDGILRLARLCGVGMTTLSADENILLERLAKSTQSFNNLRHRQVNTDAYYLFVLEEPSSQRVVGTAAIKAPVGSAYYYEVVNEAQESDSIAIHSAISYLRALHINEENSELCTLFLESDYRKNHYGALLSRARFLFIRQYCDFFSKIIMAEMRGFFDTEGHSPFWDAIGQHFFKMPFTEVDRLSMLSNRQFIADLMPKYPIYINLLPSSAQNAIGKPHDETYAAMQLLQREGFQYHNIVDLFDAGPIITAPVESIKSITNSRILLIHAIKNIIDKTLFIIANTHQNNFCATVASVNIDVRGYCTIAADTADMLHVSVGDTLHITPLLRS